MNGIDDLFGNGATEAFEEAVNTPSSQPTVIYSDWEYEPVEQVKLNNLEITVVSAPVKYWPGPGIWRKATILWDNASQEVFFQDRVIHWGNGLCQAGGGDGGILKNLATSQMRSFLATYIDEMKIALPDLSDFYNRFLLAGFEIVDRSDNEVLVAATLKDPNSKMAELFNWRINGTAPEDEPAWRIQVRESMGLDRLFP